MWQRKQKQISGENGTIMISGNAMQVRDDHFVTTIPCLEIVTLHKRKEMHLNSFCAIQYTTKFFYRFR
jgi:hypothetical protein